MLMKEYLIATFRFNDATNKKLIEKVKTLSDTKEPVRFLSHLVNCQYKWMARVLQDPNAHTMNWWEPVYDIEHLGHEWEKSLNIWLDYINSKTDES